MQQIVLFGTVQSHSFFASCTTSMHAIVFHTNFSQNYTLFPSCSQERSEFMYQLSRVSIPCPHDDPLSSLSHVIFAHILSARLSSQLQLQQISKKNKITWGAHCVTQELSRYKMRMVVLLEWVVDRLQCT